MSGAYEGVVFRSDARTARRAFAALAAPLRLRLVRLGRGVFGAYRVAGRADAFDPAAVERVAERMSAVVGQAVALFYDNSCGVRVAVVYESSRRGREFGDGDAWWAPLGEDGKPMAGGPRFRVTELQPGEEYDCVHSAIDAGLAAMGAGPQVSAGVVEQAFCYDEAELLAQAPDAVPGTSPPATPPH